MAADITWESAPKQLSIAGAEQDIWKISLNNADRDVDALSHDLSVDEARRAARFHFRIDRNRFLVAHSAKRRILSRYLGSEPGLLRFTYGTSGKPSLRSPDDWLTFNLSHGHDLALLAVAQSTPIGIDVERIISRPGLSEIARRVFTHEQLRRLEQAKNAAEREQRFYENWTAMEAAIKSLGLGIFDNLPGTNLDQFFIHHFTPEKGYLAAVATPAHDPCIRAHRFFQYCA